MTTSKFKVGDKVRILSGYQQHIGTVDVKFGKDKWMVKYNDRPGGVIAREDKLELVEESNG